MKKVIVYGSIHWPECEPVKEFLSENRIKFKYRDITENMVNLKLFLKLRDNRPEFKEIKEKNQVGLPCIVIGREEEIFFDYKDLKI